MAYNSSLIKGMALLDCYHGDTDEYGIGDFSQLTGQPESTIQRLVNTLEFIGVIFQNPNNKKYRLSLRILRSLTSARYAPQWLDNAKKELIRLQKETHETVNLRIRMGGELEYIAKVDTDQLLRPNFILGKRYPLYCTGLGRCLLSYLPREDIRELLPETFTAGTDRAQPDFEHLYNTILQTRRQGYYLDDEEFSLGLYCVAAPVFAYPGKVAAAVSVSVPKARITPDIVQHILQCTLAATKRISHSYAQILCS